jgi:hypothetical protein
MKVEDGSVIDTTTIAWNIELKFQRLPKHHPFKEKISMSNIL